MHFNDSLDHRLYSHVRAKLENTMSNNNPAAAFFANPAARGVFALLRGLDRLAPRLSTQLALRLFFTPVPTKRAARARRVPAPWRVERLPFQGAAIAAWQRRRGPPD